MGRRMSKWGLWALLASFVLFAAVQAMAADAVVSDIPADYKTVMQKNTWHPGCPVAIEDLARLRLPYWGFDGQAHTGLLIVHKRLAAEVTAIFDELYDQRFPIERMEPADAFGGSDDASMAANNTSAFNCRDITGRPGQYSLHSYGTAIDINPLVNPYVKGNIVAPPEGKAYLDRTIPAQGLIAEGDAAVRAFTRRGWTWGGAWRAVKDYQHFEKNCSVLGTCRK